MNEADEADIEASKAPLIEHLMELRERLIKALLAFLATFVALLLLRQGHLQSSCHSLHAGRGAGGEAHLHGAAGIFLHADQGRDVHGGVSLLSDRASARSTPSSRRGSTSTSARPSGPISSRRRSSSRSARSSSISSSCPICCISSSAMQQAERAGQGADRTAAARVGISFADHDAGARLRHRLSVAGGPDAARTGRHRLVGVSRREAALRRSCSSSSSRRF